MNEQLTIVKVGGKIVEDEAALAHLVGRFAALTGRKVLVHGGGRTATDVAARLGIETQMIDGRRVTDAEMLRVVTMVYAGLVGKSVVARLQAAGVCAVGLTGADMDIIRAHRRPASPVDYGFVGDVDSVDGERLAALIRSGIVPVIAPLTHNGQGQLLNTNADTIAAETAIALARHFDVTLLYCFEHPGVLRDAADPTSIIPRITAADYDRLKQSGTITGGMLPKIQNCLRAVAGGVCRVVITRADDLGREAGTVICQ